MSRMGEYAMEHPLPEPYPVEREPEVLYPAPLTRSAISRLLKYAERLEVVHGETEDALALRVLVKEAHRGAASEQRCKMLEREMGEVRRIAEVANDEVASLREELRLLAQLIDPRVLRARHLASVAPAADELVMGEARWLGRTLDLTA